MKTDEQMTEDEIMELLKYFVEAERQRKEIEVRRMIAGKEVWERKTIERNYSVNELCELIKNENIRIVPESDYKKEFDQWIKENYVGIGSKVRVTGKFEEEGEGLLHWNPDMYKTIGLVGEVRMLTSHHVLVDFNIKGKWERWYYRYTVLKPVKYEAYEKVSSSMIGKIVKRKETKVWEMIDKVNEEDNLLRVGSSLFNTQELFELFFWYYPDGSMEPCGEMK